MQGTILLKTLYYFSWIVSVTASNAYAVGTLLEPRALPPSAECRVIESSPRKILQQFDESWRRISAYLSRTDPSDQSVNAKEGSRRYSAEYCKQKNYSVLDLKTLLSKWRRQTDENHLADHRTVADFLYFDLDELDPASGVPGNVFLICDIEGEIVSMGDFTPNAKDGYLHLDRLIRSPDIAQGEGVGRIAMRHLMKVSLAHSKKGIKVLSLEGAKGFYLSMGFVEFKNDGNGPTLLAIKKNLIQKILSRP